MNIMSHYVKSLNRYSVNKEWKIFKLWLSPGQNGLVTYEALQ